MLRNPEFARLKSTSLIRFHSYSFPASLINFIHLWDKVWHSFQSNLNYQLQRNLSHVLGSLHGLHFRKQIYIPPDWIIIGIFLFVLPVVNINFWTIGQTILGKVAAKCVALPLMTRKLKTPPCVVVLVSRWAWHIKNHGTGPASRSEFGNWMTMAQSRVQFPVSPLQFQRLFIFSFQVAIWLKCR